MLRKSKQAPAEPTILSLCEGLAETTSRSTVPLKIESGPVGNAGTSCPDCHSRMMKLDQVRSALDAGQVDDQSGNLVPCLSQLSEWLRAPVQSADKGQGFGRKAVLTSVTVGGGSFLVMCGTLIVLGGQMSVTWGSMFAVPAAGLAAKSLKNSPAKGRVELPPLDEEHDARLRTWEERISVYHHLYYCGSCAIILDARSNRHVPWFRLLELFVPDVRPPLRVDSSRIEHRLGA